MEGYVNKCNLTVVITAGNMILSIPKPLNSIALPGGAEPYEPVSLQVGKLMAPVLGKP